MTTSRFNFTKLDFTTSTTTSTSTTSTTTSTSTLPPFNTTSPTPPPSDGLENWAIGLICNFAVLVVLVILAALFFCYKKNKFCFKKKTRNSFPRNITNNTYEAPKKISAGQDISINTNATRKLPSQISSINDTNVYETPTTPAINDTNVYEAPIPTPAINDTNVYEVPTPTPTINENQRRPLPDVPGVISLDSSESSSDSSEGFDVSHGRQISNATEVSSDLDIEMSNVSHQRQRSNASERSLPKTPMPLPESQSFVLDVPPPRPPKSPIVKHLMPYLNENTLQSNDDDVNLGLNCYKELEENEENYYDPVEVIDSRPNSILPPSSTRSSSSSEDENEVTNDDQFPVWPENLYTDC